MALKYVWSLVPSQLWSQNYSHHCPGAEFLQPHVLRCPLSKAIFWTLYYVCHFIWFNSHGNIPEGGNWGSESLSLAWNHIASLTVPGFKPGMSDCQTWERSIQLSPGMEERNWEASLGLLGQVRRRSHCQCSRGCVASKFLIIGNGIKQRRFFPCR